MTLLRVKEKLCIVISKALCLGQENTRIKSTPSCFNDSNDILKITYLVGLVKLRES